MSCDSHKYAPPFFVLTPDGYTVRLFSFPVLSSDSATSSDFQCFLIQKERLVSQTYLPGVLRILKICPPMHINFLVF